MLIITSQKIGNIFVELSRTSRNHVHNNITKFSILTVYQNKLKRFTFLAYITSIVL